MHLTENRETTLDHLRAVALKEQQLRHARFAAVSAMAMKEYREANPELFEQEGNVVVTSIWDDLASSADM